MEDKHASPPAPSIFASWAKTIIGAVLFLAGRIPAGAIPYHARTIPWLMGSWVIFSAINDALLTGTINPHFLLAALRDMLFAFLFLATLCPMHRLPHAWMITAALYSAIGMLAIPLFGILPDLLLALLVISTTVLGMARLVHAATYGRIPASVAGTAFFLAMIGWFLAWNTVAA